MNQPDPISTLKTRLVMLEQDFLKANEVSARLRESGASHKTVNAHLMTLASIAEDMDKASTELRALTRTSVE